MDFNCHSTHEEPLRNAVEDIVYLTNWGKKWLKYSWHLVSIGGSAERFAKSVIDKIDEINEEPEEFLVKHTYTASHTIEEFDGIPVVEMRMRSTRKIRTGNRSNFAAAVSKHAYLKFGNRKMTEANILVTRKWIVKYLEDDKFKDMRTVDKALAVDRALFLSFVPSDEFRRMRLAVTTKQWEKRVEPERVFGGTWSRVFGVGKLREHELLESC